MAPSHIYNSSMMIELTFAHLSDIHMLPEGQLYNTLDVHARAASVLDAVDRLETPPAFMLITGDNINEVEMAASYDRLKRLLARVCVPVVFALGNHDVRRDFRAAFASELAPFLAVPGVSDEPCHGRAIINNTRVLVLDTLVPGFTQGLLDEAQLAWLARELDAPFGGATILALHHCPLPIPTTRFADHQLTNARALEQVLLGARAKPIGLLCGHIHYTNIGLFAGVPCVSAPGIAMGIAPDAQRGLRMHDCLGFNVCHIIDGRFIVNPVITQAESRTIKYDAVMAWQ